MWGYTYLRLAISKACTSRVKCRFYPSTNRNMTTPSKEKPKTAPPVALPEVVLPGDVVLRLSEIPEGVVRLGPGLIQNKDQIIATKAGSIRFKPPNKYWVEYNQKRYIPGMDDMVIGIVTDVHADSFKVDIGSSQQATLPMLAFEGATRKNRPNLEIGGLVYARVVLANKDMEPELKATAANGKAEGFGELEGGYMFKTSLGLARSLLVSESPILNLLGKTIPFEIAVGQNGRVWVKAGNPIHTVLVANAILASEKLAPALLPAMVQRLTETFR